MTTVLQFAIWICLLEPCTTLLHHCHTWWRGTAVCSDLAPAASCCAIILCHGGLGYCAWLHPLWMRSTRCISKLLLKSKIGTPLPPPPRAYSYTLTQLVGGGGGGGGGGGMWEVVLPSCRKMTTSGFEISNLVFRYRKSEAYK
jgi:hypothetical protein